MTQSYKNILVFLSCIDIEIRSFWILYWRYFACCDILTSNFVMTISCALRDLLRIEVERLNRVKNTLLNQSIILLFHALTCNEEKEWRWRFCKFLSANRIEFSVMFSMKFSKQSVIINCCAAIADFIWLEILDRNSYETNCIRISIERCKSWWL